MSAPRNITGIKKQRPLNSQAALLLKQPGNKGACGGTARTPAAHLPWRLGVCEYFKVSHQQGLIGFSLCRGEIHLQLHLSHRQLLLLLGRPQVPQVPPQQVGLNKRSQLGSLQQRKEIET
jgi:hypothetical protein